MSRRFPDCSVCGSPHGPMTTCELAAKRRQVRAERRGSGISPRVRAVLRLGTFFKCPECDHVAALQGSSRMTFEKALEVGQEPDPYPFLSRRPAIECPACGKWTALVGQVEPAKSLA